MNNPGKLYGLLATLAKHINDTNSKFICVIAKGKDGKFEVYNSDVVDVDDLLGASTALKETMENFQNRING